MKVTVLYRKSAARNVSNYSIGLNKIINIQSLEYENNFTLNHDHTYCSGFKVAGGF